MKANRKLKEGFLLRAEPLPDGQTPDPNRQKE